MVITECDSNRTRTSINSTIAADRSKKNRRSTGGATADMGLELMATTLLSPFISMLPPVFCVFWLELTKSTISLTLLTANPRNLIQSDKSRMQAK